MYNKSAKKYLQKCLGLILRIQSTKSLLIVDLIMLRYEVPNIS
jgi:hypothetical protein